jgi:hypothetical protein
MCYYHFYIFIGCGHSTFSSTPVRYCANVTNLETQDGAQPESILPEPLDKGNTNWNVKTTTTNVVRDLEAGPQPQVAQALATQDCQRLPTKEKIIIPASRIPVYQPCEEGRAHPLHTRKVETICAECEHARLNRLRKLDEVPGIIEIKFVRKPREGRPLVRRTSEEMILQGKADGVGKVKVDSGTWATGTKWMEGWKRGSG